MINKEVIPELLDNLIDVDAFYLYGDGQVSVRTLDIEETRANVSKDDEIAKELIEDVLEVRKSKRKLIVLVDFSQLGSLEISLIERKGLIDAVKDFAKQGDKYEC